MIHRQHRAKRTQAEQWALTAQRMKAEIAAGIDKIKKAREQESGRKFERTEGGFRLLG